MTMLAFPSFDFRLQNAESTTLSLEPFALSLEP